MFLHRAFSVAANKIFQPGEYVILIFMTSLCETRRYFIAPSQENQYSLCFTPIPIAIFSFC
jgi:hypothetical protein